MRQTRRGGGRRLPVDQVGRSDAIYFALTRIGAISVMALRAHRRTEICH